MEAEVILNTKKLDIGYGSTYIAKNLMLSLYAGEMVCLIGPNGCGKSTLFRLITGEMDPTSGSIYFSKGKSLSSSCIEAGFGNYGNFAYNYKKIFGKSPREDLK